MLITFGRHNRKPQSTGGRDYFSMSSNSDRAHSSGDPRHEGSKSGRCVVARLREAIVVALFVRLQRDARGGEFQR